MFRTCERGEYKDASVGKRKPSPPLREVNVALNRSFTSLWRRVADLQFLQQKLEIDLFLLGRLNTQRFRVDDGAS